MEIAGGPVRAADAVHHEQASRRPHVFTDALSGREAFLKLRREWDAALAAGPDPSPFLDHDFLRLWLETFAASQQPMILTARREQRLAGALGLLVGPARIEGVVPVRLAQAWCNSHSNRGGVLLGAEGVPVIDALVHRLLDEPWDVLSLRDLPRERGILDAISEALRREHCAVGYESPMDSPYVPLPPTWAEFEGRLDAHFRQNLRRRRRRLEEHGTVQLEVLTTTEGLDAALEDAFSIEASGWKGEERSAIRARPELVSFYSSWARRLGQQERLRLCFLKVGERRIAFHFGFVQADRYYLPKCGFDEGFRECSPGQLLISDVLRRCIDEHLQSFEFLGFSMPWKRDWTPLVRPHASVWAYRGTPRGRLARFARLELRPRVAKAWRSIEALRKRVPA